MTNSPNYIKAVNDNALIVEAFCKEHGNNTGARGMNGLINTCDSLVENARCQDAHALGRLIEKYDELGGKEKSSVLGSYPDFMTLRTILYVIDKYANKSYNWNAKEIHKKLGKHILATIPCFTYNFLIEGKEDIRRILFINNADVLRRCVIFQDDATQHTKAMVDAIKKAMRGARVYSDTDGVEVLQTDTISLYPENLDLKGRIGELEKKNEDLTEELECRYSELQSVNDELTAHMLENEELKRDRTAMRDYLHKTSLFEEYKTEMKMNLEKEEDVPDLLDECCEPEGEPHILDGVGFASEEEAIRLWKGSVYQKSREEYFNCEICKREFVGGEGKLNWFCGEGMCEAKMNLASAYGKFLEPEKKK